MGARLCLQNPSAGIITTRSRENLMQLNSLGLEAVEFDLAREDTWNNLPSRESVSSTVITFPLSRSQIPSLQKLLEEYVNVDRPILCLGTTSAFQVDDYTSVVSEKTPLTGLSITGKSLEDRTGGENWILSRGASVLHLSGIVGDEKERVSYGKPRFIGPFVQGCNNGYKLVNVIHVTDICKILSFFLEKSCRAESIKGERLIVSSGAYRYQDLAKGLGLDPLPEIIPTQETMKNSKIISVAKLCSMLPADYKWTLPVEGVEPISMGLPTIGPLKFYSTGAARDRQWELMRKNLSGKWKATTMWYERGDLDHSAFVTSLNGEQLPPSLLVPNTEYHIYFFDADTGIWHGKGLKFAPGGEKKLDISRKNFNKYGKVFCCEGISGQCDIGLGSSSFGFEVNFLYEHSRSMIVVLYKPALTSTNFLLNAVCIAPFRCGNQHDTFPLKPPQNEIRRSVDALLAGLCDKTCRMQWMSHTHALDETDGGEVQAMPTKSMLLLSSSDSSRLVQSFDDDLVCSIPVEVVAGQACEFVFGCRHTDKLFRSITITYDCENKLEKEIFERWE